MDVDESFETEADGTVTLRPGTGGNFKGTLKPGAATLGLLMGIHGWLVGLQTVGVTSVCPTGSALHAAPDC